MAKNVFQDMNLTDLSYLLDPDSADSAEEKTEDETGSSRPDTVMINVDSLVSFKNHPFHVDTESDDFGQLKDSIQENGILVPIFVRPISATKYEIIAGHCRVAAAKECGLTEVPAVVRPLSDYEATLVMVHTNINGRGQITVSEKAKAYRMCMEAEKHQGVKGEDTAAIMGNGADSKRQVYRFIRLSYLSDFFLGHIDNGRLSVQAGLEIAYIDDSGQAAVEKYMEVSGKSLSAEQAARLRSLYEQNGKKLSYEKVVAELTELPKMKPATKVSFKTKEIAEFFDEGTGADEMEDVILKLLAKYRDGQIDITSGAEKNQE